MYAAKFGTDEDKFMKKLWGNHYYNPDTRKWNKTGGKGYNRGFNKFVLEPLFKVLKNPSMHCATLGLKDSVVGV